MISQITVKMKIFDALYKSKETMDEEFEEIKAWITDIIENAERPKLDHCEICNSKENLEQHHVRGNKHGYETITVCRDCHKKLTDKQRLWDTSWLDPNSKNKDAFLIRGLIDIFELKYEKTHEEIYKLIADILTEEFCYD